MRTPCLWKPTLWKFRNCVNVSLVHTSGIRQLRKGYPTRNLDVFQGSRGMTSVAHTEKNFRDVNCSLLTRDGVLTVSDILGKCIFCSVNVLDVFLGSDRTYLSGSDLCPKPWEDSWIHSCNSQPQSSKNRNGQTVTEPNRQKCSRKMSRSFLAFTDWLYRKREIVRRPAKLKAVLWDSGGSGNHSLQLPTVSSGTKTKDGKKTQTIFALKMGCVKGVQVREYSENWHLFFCDRHDSVFKQTTQQQSFYRLDGEGWWYLGSQAFLWIILEKLSKGTSNQCWKFSSCYGHTKISLDSTSFGRKFYLAQKELLQAKPYDRWTVEIAEFEPQIATWCGLWFSRQTSWKSFPAWKRSHGPNTRKPFVYLKLDSLLNSLAISESYPWP